jgi:D-apionolactonase
VSFNLRKIGKLVKLKTSKYTIFYENGSIRWIKVGNIEIVRMIYSAVRDHNWGTIEPEIIAENIEETEWGFRVEVRLKYQKHDIDFEAHYIILGEENQLFFEMQGEAKSTFLSNRTGFCVLHPIKECEGKTCTVLHPNGIYEKTIFPEFVSPVQPMMNISAMEWETENGVSAKLSFTGDIFEMEDQRNWTDASFKTYCRPLSMPFPFEIKKGEKLQQKIVLEIWGELQNEINDNIYSFSFDKNNTFKIPEIGIGATSRNEPLENTESELLKKLPLKHLHAEIKLFEKSWKLVLAKEIAESTLLELPLFLVMYFSEKFEDEIKEVRLNFQNQKIKIKYILVVGKNHLPDDLIFDAVFDELKTIFPETKIGAGVNAYFAELNRNRPQSLNAEFISFTICPQIHAFDNATMLENLEAQKYVVETARKLFPEKPVFVSPVTLKQRFNVVATCTEPAPATGELPSQVYTRQNSDFAAQWLICSLKYLAQSGTHLITYFESVGWRGFIQGNYDPPVPGKFKAKKGDVFPVYFALKELAGFSEIIHSNSSHPLLFDGLVVQSIDKIKLFIFSFSNEDIVIKINPKYYANESKKYVIKKNTEIKKNSILLRANEFLEILW